VEHELLLQADSALGQMAHVIGVNATLALCDQFAGQSVWFVSRVDMFRRLFAPVRAERMVEAYLRGESVTEIADAWAVSRVVVYKALRRAGALRRPGDSATPALSRLQSADGSSRV